MYLDLQAGCLGCVKNATINATGIHVADNIAGGFGGGMAISIPPDEQPVVGGCPSGKAKTFWNFTHDAQVFIDWAQVINNSAVGGDAGGLRVGGGLYMGQGGALTLSNSIVVGNHATLFGGGLGLGGGGGSETCGVALVGCQLANNTADHGGAQLYMACAADLDVNATVMQLGTTGSQVRQASVGVRQTGRGEGALRCCIPPPPWA